MVPIVRINDKVVESKLISRVDILHSLNDFDGAYIEWSTPATVDAYKRKQPVRIDLASGGPTLFDGYIDNIPSGSSKTPEILFCLGSIHAHAPAFSADTAFLDTLTRLPFTPVQVAPSQSSRSKCLS